MGWVSVALGWWPFADPSPAALPKGPQRPPEALLIERRSAVARYLPKYASPLVPLVPLVPRLVDRLIFPSGERRFSFSILHASRSVCTTRPLQLIGNPRLRRTSRPNMVKQNDKDKSEKTKEKRILSGNFTPEPGPTIWEWVVESCQVVLVCVCTYGALSSYP